METKFDDPESRLKEFSQFYSRDPEQVRKVWNESCGYFEGAWEGMDPKTNEEYQRYYTGRWHTLRQMAYTESMVFDGRINEFLDKISREQSCLDYCCGTGDYIIYLASKGVKCYVVEVEGEKCKFLRYRFDKRSLDVTIIPTRFGDPIPDLPEVDFSIAVSALDHVPDPVLLAGVLVAKTKRTIFASPCIDEHYDRPCHVKEILKNVPAAFDVIRGANKLAEEIPQ